MKGIIRIGVQKVWGGGVKWGAPFGVRRAYRRGR